MSNQAPIYIRDLRERKVYVIDKLIMKEYARHLGCYTLSVYHALCCAINYQTQQGHPSISAIAEWLNISRQTVRKCLDRPELHGLIAMAKVLNPEGQVKQYLFTILQVGPWNEEVGGNVVTTDDFLPGNRVTTPLVTALPPSTPAAPPENTLPVSPDQAAN